MNNYFLPLFFSPGNLTLVDVKLISFFFFFPALQLIIWVLQISFDEIFSLTCTHPHFSFRKMSELPFLFNILMEKLWVFKSGFAICFAKTALTAAVGTGLLAWDERAPLPDRRLANCSLSQNHASSKAQGHVKTFLQPISLFTCNTSSFESVFSFSKTRISQPHQGQWHY